MEAVGDELPLHVGAVEVGRPRRRCQERAPAAGPNRISLGLLNITA